MTVFNQQNQSVGRQINAGGNISFGSATDAATASAELQKLLRLVQEAQVASEDGPSLSEVRIHTEEAVRVTGSGSPDKAQALESLYKALASVRRCARPAADLVALFTQSIEMVQRTL